MNQSILPVPGGVMMYQRSPLSPPRLIRPLPTVSGQGRVCLRAPAPRTPPHLERNQITCALTPIVTSQQI
ncbi:hypothetical protein MHYP_G00176850 [Metynnis hypsauchen]